MHASPAMMLRLHCSWTRNPALRRTISSTCARRLVPSAPLLAKPLPPRIQINDADVTISYLKGSGPGGQKINKTNSAVQIIHKPTGIVVKCQATRSRSQNQKIAHQLLADKVEKHEKGDQSRVAMKTEKARKKKASKMKKTRRKYRESEKEEMETEDADEEEQEEEMQQNTNDRDQHDAEENTKSPPSA